MILDQKTLMNILHYDPLTGLFTWINVSKYHGQLNGKNAGCMNRGYIKIKINRFAYFAHRLAWLYVHGEFPHQIDHINRTRDDNRISNLRECTSGENARNHGKTINGSGLPVGVRLAASDKFHSRITYKKKVYYLGAFTKAGDAHNAYLSKRDELFGEFSPS